MHPRRRVTGRRSGLVSVLLCFLLVALPAVSGLQSGNAQRAARASVNPPTKGAPAKNLPNLDEVRRRGPAQPKALPPVPSTLKKCPPDEPNCNAAGHAFEAGPGRGAIPVGNAGGTSRASALLGTLLLTASNPYAGVMLASRGTGLPEPPRRPAGDVQRSSAPGWLSSLGSLFGVSAAARSMPQGGFENADCYYAWGYAWDSAQPNVPILVTLFDGTRPVATMLADQLRTDIIQMTGDDGRHGFRFTLPESLRDGGTHSLSVQVQGTGFTLGYSPKIVSSCTVSYDGAITSADCDQITGWAWDAGRPSTPIDVDIFIDGVFRARAAADVYDASLGRGDNRHRFRLPTPEVARDGQAHTVTIRPADSAQVLGSPASTGNCYGPNYGGYLEYADCEVIAGWAIDTNRLNAALSVDIYANNVFVTTVVADNFRQDLVNAFGGNGRHGFTVAVPDSLRDGVSRQLTARVSGTGHTLGTIAGPIACAARARCSATQSLPSPEFVKYFYQGALARQPRQAELQYWNEALRSAASQGQQALLDKAKLLGRELFRQGEYANIQAARPAAGKEEADVADRYRGYQQRGPDAGGQSWWAGNIRTQNSQGQDGWVNAFLGFQESGEFAARVASICPSPAASVKSYDPVVDFSPLQNPDGGWAYGYRPSGGAFTTFASNGSIWGGGTSTWSRDGASCPFITRNNTSGAVSYAGVVTQPPDVLNLHPGPGGERAVTRWAAPAAGTYIFQGRFQGIDTTGTTTDVAVTHNGTNIFAGNVNGYGATAPFSVTRSVAAGDTIEFSVGFGSNGNYNDDSTGLAVTISQPPPAQTQPYNSTPAQVPGNIEAELFDAGGEGVAYHDTTPGTHGQDYDQPGYPPPAFRQPTDVDIYKQAAGYSNGYLVVMQAGDWMNYTVDVAQGGLYTVSARTYYWGAPGGTFHIESDGVDVTGPLQLPGGSSWQTVGKSRIQLNAGRHVLRVVCDTNGSDGAYMGDIDYLRLTPDTEAGLVARWKFDEGAGAAASDSSGYGNAGTLQNGASWAAGKVGTAALNFDGVDDHVAISANSSLTTIADNFTIAFWALPRSPHEIDPEGVPCCYGTSGQRYAVSPGYVPPGEAGAGVSVGTNGVSVYEHSAGYMPATAVYQGALNGWTHVAVVYENKQPKLYVNGRLVRTGAQSGRSAVRLNPYWLGGMEYGHFDGQLDDVRVYSRSLNAGDVGALAIEGGADPTGNDFSEAKKDPANEIGSGDDDALSRNFNFSVPLVTLRGRAGLDLGLTLSYNSLVWTRDAATGVVKFDADFGDPSPGFRLGLPVIHRKYRNARGENAYMLVTPTGSRVEMRQVGGSNVYEATDSSYLQLTEDGGLTLRSTDGTQLTFAVNGYEYKCTQVKDRNGNFITVVYNAAGLVSSITDTLARVITFAYDANGRPTAIEQNRNGQTHQWATFGYANLTMGTLFADPSKVIGPANGTAISVLNRVSLQDGSRYDFLYNSWGQVYRVERRAPDGRLLSYTEYDLQAPTSAHTAGGTDCPRFTQRRDFIKDWNNDAPAVTSYSVDQSGAQVITQQNGLLPDGVHPDYVKQVIYYGPAGTWQGGLVNKVETYSTRRDGQNTDPNVYDLRRTAQTTWTQDDESLSYRLNPRIKKSEVSDPQGHHTGTSVEYTSFGLPTEEREWSATEASVLRRTHTEYNLDPAYMSRRVIGLVSSVSVYDEQGQVASKVDYTYDQGGEFLQSQGEPVQHDGANYGPTFIQGRGLATSVRRWDVTALHDISRSVASKVGYDTAGSTIFVRDARGRQMTASYADRFTDKAGTNTLAYPTQMTDPGGFSSKVEYVFDTGLVARKANPNGVQQTFTYDPAGRTLRLETSGKDAATGQPVSGGYVRWVYSDAMDAMQSWTLVDAGKPEACSITVVDGAGRKRAAASDFPGSNGGYRAQYTSYDIAGRVSATTNPTEINGLWSPAGEDAAGWNWTTQTYDWKGRPLVTTSPGGTTQEAAYGGCGCAGGDVVTIKGEMVQTNAPPPEPAQAQRTQKLYHDAFGRVVKAEMYKWDGVTVYSTTTTRYNVLDQVLRTRVYQGGAPDPEPGAEASTYQTTTMAYDGHGRLQSRHTPEQDAGRSTVYTYNADDTLASVTDARGAKAIYDYDARRLVTSVTFDLSGVAAGQNVTDTPNLTFGYDAAGNRTEMNEVGLGRVTYAYDALSRLTSETRTFVGLSGTYPLYYSYNLAGQLESLTDPSGATTHYNHDGTGQVDSVTATGTIYAGVNTYASAIKYRAWGAVKGLTYGNNFTLSMSYDNRLRPAEFRVATPQGAATMRTHYGYYGDGQLRLADDLLDDRFDRAYSYDHMGRLADAFTGTEAREFAGGQAPSGAQDGPYRQTYHYNAFSNLAGRDNRFWSQTDSFTANYTNNRRDGWQYDLAGNVVSDGQLTYKWDAAGRNRQTDDATGRASFQWHSGEGQVIKHAVFQNNTWTEVEYFLRSSALGGQIVAQLNGQGQKQKGYVYLGNQIIAEQGATTSAFTFRHDDPVIGSRTESAQNGSSWTAIQADPMGVNVGMEDPFVIFDPPGFDPQPEAPMLFPLMDGGCSSANPTCRQCFLDGMSIGCDRAAFLMDIGAAEFDTQATVRITYTSGRVETFTGHTNLPPGLDITFRGPEAVLAGAVFQFWMPNFGFAVNTAIGAVVVARMGAGDGTGGDLFRGFASSFAPLSDPQRPGRTPEQPTIPIQNLRQNIEKMLKTGNCGKFVQQLLDKAAELFPKNSPRAQNILEAFDNISSQGGYVLTTGIGYHTVSGDYYVHKETGGAAWALSAMVHIVPWYNLSGRAPSARTVAMAQAYYSLAALHETFHLAARGGFSDEQMAQAVAALTGAPGLPKPGSDVTAFSNYWDHELAKNCPEMKVK